MQSGHFWNNTSYEIHARRRQRPITHQTFKQIIIFSTELTSAIISAFNNTRNLVSIPTTPNGQWTHDTPSRDINSNSNIEKHEERNKGRERHKETTHQSLSKTLLFIMLGQTISQPNVHFPYTQNAGWSSSSRILNWAFYQTGQGHLNFQQIWAQYRLQSAPKLVKTSDFSPIDT